MKTLTLVCLLIFVSENITAQDDKNNFFIETGIKLTGGGEYLNFMGKTGIAYNKNTLTYYHPGDHTSEFSHDAFSWSLAPRVGYQLDKLFSTGIDFQYFSRTVKDYMTYTHSTAGVFLRKNITTTRVRLFIEFSYGLGRTKEESDEMSSGGGKYKRIEKTNLHYFAGAAGVSFPLFENFRLSFTAKIQNTIEKDSKQPDTESTVFKDSNVEIAPIMSITYIIKRKN
jgi:hypothetical protein